MKIYKNKLKLITFANNNWFISRLIQIKFHLENMFKLRGYKWT